MKAGQRQKTAQFLPKGKTVEWSIANADEFLSRGTGDPVAESEKIDEVEHVGEAEIKV